MGSIRLAHEYYRYIEYTGHDYVQRSKGTNIYIYIPRSCYNYYYYIIIKCGTLVICLNVPIYDVYNTSIRVSRVRRWVSVRRIESTERIIYTLAERKKIKTKSLDALIRARTNIGPSQRIQTNARPGTCIYLYSFTWVHRWWGVGAGSRWVMCRGRSRALCGGAGVIGCMVKNTLGPDEWIRRMGHGEEQTSS